MSNGPDDQPQQPQDSGEQQHPFPRTPLPDVRVVPPVVPSAPTESFAPHEPASAESTATYASPSVPETSFAPTAAAPAADEPTIAPLTSSTGSGNGKRKGKGKDDGEERSFAKELPVLIGIALVLALLLRIFAVQAFYIPSASMEQTLHIGDRVLVSKVGYHFHDPRRGDIVVFNGKHTNFPPENIVSPASNIFVSAQRKLQQLLGLGTLGERDYIKRVIGVGGDTVQCCSNGGNVMVNGRELHESYLYEDDHMAFCANTAPGASPLVPQRGAACLASDAKPFVVPKGYLFVMGDHRGDSSDSRYNGVIPKSAVVGRAFVIVWPLSRLDRFGTPPDFS